MIEILINNNIVATCLPQLVNLFVQALIPNLGLEYKIETRKQQVQTKE